MLEKDTITSVRPCPFCGQANTVVSAETIPVLGHGEEVREATVYQVCCETCNAEGPVTTTEVTADVAEAELQNIKLWNQRVDQNDDTQPDLKNCPFCGRQPEVLHDSGTDESDTSADPTIIEIFCSDCGASGPASDKDDLMVLWNKRM